MTLPTPEDERKANTMLFVFVALGVIVLAAMFGSTILEAVKIITYLFS